MDEGTEMRVFRFMPILLLSSLLVAPGRAATPLATVRIGSGFTQPLYLTAPPNDTSRLFVVEQGGQIKIIKNGVKLARSFLNISDRISTGF